MSEISGVYHLGERYEQVEQVGRFFSPNKRGGVFRMQPLGKGRKLDYASLHDFLKGVEVGQEIALRGTERRVEKYRLEADRWGKDTGAVFSWNNLDSPEQLGDHYYIYGVKVAQENGNHAI